MRLPFLLRKGDADTGSPRQVRPGVATSQHGDNAVISAKYTWLNMIPKATFEQFRRLSNFYFLIVAIISFIPNISPSTPVTTTLPLIVVVGFGLARDVFEDTKRKKSDAATNSAPVVVRRRLPGTEDKLLSPPESRSSAAKELESLDDITVDDHIVLKSRDVSVGDVVLLREDCEFPCDLVLLASSDPAGVCYVSTANLDGESNLKRRVIPSILHETVKRPEELRDLSASVTVNPPTPALYTFVGSIECEGEDAVPLDVSNLLLRGSVLRNTEYVYGLVVYNGAETKVALNMRNPPSKLGGVERVMNRVVIGLFSILMLITIIMATLAGVWQSRRGEGQWYMGELSELSGVTVALRSLGTFIILFHTFLPISLFVTLEFVRLFQGMFISADSKMISRGVPVESKANNLNESLGYVQHIFSDKTGTLTENVMRFVACYVADATYDLRKHPTSVKQAAKDDSEGVKAFIRAMALSHDVIPRKKSGGDEKHGGYTGESPDEVALVQAAADAGVKLVDRTLTRFVVNEFGRGEDSYELLAELAFTSERKRMSTVLRCPDGKVRMYTKGADSVMIRLLDYRTSLTEIEYATDSFSKEGLRTLVYGTRLIPEDEYEEFATHFAEASNALEKRAERKAEVAEKLEKNLAFAGVTAVEDKLQDDVPSTIKFLRDAGMRVWVLTGDKRETAENIGYSSHLLSRDMRVYHIAAESKEELEDRIRELLGENRDDPTASPRASKEESVLTEADEHVESETESEKRRRRRRSSILGSITLLPEKRGVERDIALIIDGHSLSFVEGDNIEELFLRIAGMCKSVICARVTPLQKAQIVKIVRKHERSNTLAIGDGGNDVSMIQEAHIGVGIKGKEGMQASRAADYSMAEFRHLRRLLSVHGRFSYVRTTGVINLSFYKNIFFSGTQILFQFFAFASGTTVHDQWIVTAFNSMLTLIPPFLYGIFERDLDEGTVLQFPSVYQSNSNNKLFSMRTVLEYTIAYSAWHAIVLFFAVYLLFGRWQQTVFPNGQDSGLFLVGLALSTMAVPMALFKFLLSSHIWNVAVILGVVISFGLMWALIPVFVHVAKEYPLEGVLSKLFTSPLYHLVWPIVFVVAFMPDVGVIMYRMARGGNLVAQLQRYEIRKARGR